MSAPYRILKLARAAGAMGTIGLSACTLMPHYERPDSGIASTYPDTVKTTTASAANSAANSATNSADAAQDTVADTLSWRDFYQDDALRALIRMGLENNRDLRVAILNVQAAQAQYRIQRADELPTLSMDASGDVERYPKSISPTGYEETAHAYHVDGAVASYEVDLFGRVRSLSEEALQSYFSTMEARKAAQISLISEIATAWLTYQADANLRKLSADTLKSQEEGYRITDATFKDGTGDALDVSQAETTVRSAQADLAKYDRQVHQDVNALTLLIGVPAPSQWLTVVPMQSIRLNDRLKAGLPSDLLTRRPDILEAEAKLKSANADIGAARADFFPQITLTAAGGTASAKLSNLFGAGSAEWSFAPEITLPIFDYGRNMANLKLSKVDRNIQVAQYQKVIQTAFREVANALDGVNTYRQQETAETRWVQATARSYHLSSVQYRDGTSAYLPVLVSQRALFSAQQDLITLQLAHASNTVSLYAALGGGWNSPVMLTTPTTPTTPDSAVSSQAAAASPASPAFVPPALRR